MPSATASLTVHAPAPASLADALDALDQLEQSERGRLAAVAFRRFLAANDNSAFSLDANNWRALETLVRACKLNGANNVYPHLPKR